MPDFEIARITSATGGAEIAAARTDRSLVVVVAGSKISRIVMSRIVERIGLKSLAVSHDDAWQCLSRHNPAIIVVDVAADQSQCDAFLAEIAVRRAAKQDRFPMVVLLTRTNAPPERLESRNVVDAFVAKPITPEALQPLILRMIEESAG